MATSTTVPPKTNTVPSTAASDPQKSSAGKWIALIVIGFILLILVGGLIWWFIAHSDADSTEGTEPLPGTTTGSTANNLALPVIMGVTTILPGFGGYYADANNNSVCIEASDDNAIGYRINIQGSTNVEIFRYLETYVDGQSESCVNTFSSGPVIIGPKTFDWSQTGNFSSTDGLYYTLYPGAIISMGPNTSPLNYVVPNIDPATQWLDIVVDTNGTYTSQIMTNVPST